MDNLHHVFDRDDMHQISNVIDGKRILHDVGSYCLRCKRFVRDPSHLTPQANPEYCPAPLRIEER